MKEDPDHSIIESPFTWQVADFHYHRSGDDLDQPDEAWIDLTLMKKGQARRLRFLKPQSINVSNGFDCPGLFISDVSRRQLGNLKVHVGDFESGEGGIEFWAADVIDLDKVEKENCEPPASADAR